MEKIMFGAGCFWGVESAFRTLKGVIDAPCGYSGGQKANPTYKEVCTGTTGHAEVVQVEYDPSIITVEELLAAFFKIHNPTTRDRQGPDVGSQYRSAIYYNSPEQKEAAEKMITELQNSGQFSSPIVTEVKEADTFWIAEEYHQRYFEKHNRPSCHVL